MSYPRMSTRVELEAGQVTVTVEHDPRQSFARAVYPAAWRALCAAPAVTRAYAELGTGSRSAECLGMLPQADPDGLEPGRCVTSWAWRLEVAHPHAA